MSLRQSPTNPFDDVVVLDSPPAPVPSRNAVPSSTNLTPQPPEVIDLDMSPTSSLDDIAPRKRRRRDQSSPPPSTSPVIDLDAEDSPNTHHATPTINHNTNNNHNNNTLHNLHTHTPVSDPSVTLPHPVSADPLNPHHRLTLFSPLQAFAPPNPSPSDDIIETAAAGPRISSAASFPASSPPDPSQLHSVEHLSPASNNSIELVHTIPPPRPVMHSTSTQHHTPRASMPSLLPPSTSRNSSIDPITHRFAPPSIPSLRASDTSVPRLRSPSPPPPPPMPSSPHVSPFVVSDTSPPRLQSEDAARSTADAYPRSRSAALRVLHSLPLSNDIPGYAHLMFLSGAAAGPSNAATAPTSDAVAAAASPPPQTPYHQQSTFDSQDPAQRRVRFDSTVEIMDTTATTYIPPSVPWPRLTPPFMLETPVRSTPASSRRSYRAALPRNPSPRVHTSAQRDVPLQSERTTRPRRMTFDEVASAQPVMLHASRGSVMQHMFGDISEAVAARINRSQRPMPRRANGRGSRSAARHAGSSSNEAGSSSATHGGMSSSRPPSMSRRRVGEISLSLFGGQSRHETPHPAPQVRHIVVRSGDPGEMTGFYWRYLHSSSGFDHPMDYENLVRLDEQWLREKNRAGKEQIESLPMEKASAADKEIRCCVCMCDVEEGEELRVLPCKHKYHKSCIDEWLTYNGCCPVDKKRIAPPRPRR